MIIEAKKTCFSSQKILINNTALKI